MSTYIEGGTGNKLVDNVLFILLIGAVGLLFIGLSQPLWRGQEMIQEVKDRCALAEGKMYERKSWLGGTVYECIGGSHDR